MTRYIYLSFVVIFCELLGNIADIVGFLSYLFHLISELLVICCLNYY
jgi:hypothetical protein